MIFFRLFGVRLLLLVVWMVRGWRDLQSLPVPWFDGLARILAKVEELGVWPAGLLDVYIALILKVG